MTRLCTCEGEGLGAPDKGEVDGGQAVRYEAEEMRGRTRGDWPSARPAAIQRVKTGALGGRQQEKGGEEGAEGRYITAETAWEGDAAYKTGVGRMGGGRLDPPDCGGAPDSHDTAAATNAPCTSGQRGAHRARGTQTRPRGCPGKSAMSSRVVAPADGPY